MVEKEEAAKEEKQEHKNLNREKIVEGEKVFTIPLRKAFAKARTKRTDYAVSLVRDFLIRHLKTEDVRLGKHINQEIMKRIPRRIRVKVFIDEVDEKKVAKAELVGYEYEEFKVEKFERKGRKEKLLERLGGKALKKQQEEEMIEGKKEEKEAPKTDSAKKFDELG